jgi:hypothetical protein
VSECSQTKEARLLQAWNRIKDAFVIKEEEEKEEEDWFLFHQSCWLTMKISS